MLVLRGRGLCGRVTSQMTSLSRPISGEERESPAQMDRRLMKEEERRMQSDFYSVFELLRPSKTTTVDYFRRLNSQFTFTKANIQAAIQSKIVEERVLSQRFLEERHQALGYDLAAAHFLIARGGRIRFKGDKRWYTKTEDGRVPLPGQYTFGMYVEALDCSGTEILYEGLENFINLQHLRALLLRDCPYVDDWCVDRICGEYRDVLQHLDLSGCRRVTASGLEGLSQLKKLRTLTLENMEHVEALPYVCMLLEDAIPGLEVLGVDLLQEPQLSLSQPAPEPASQSQQSELSAGDLARTDQSDGDLLEVSRSRRVAYWFKQWV